MEISRLIDETIERLNIRRTYVCFEKIYKPIYEQLILKQCKSSLKVLQVENFTFQDLKLHFDVLDENDLIILIFPFHVLESDSSSMHNYLMNLEKKGIFFINFSAGVEGVDFTTKVQELYNKLLFKIIKNNSQKLIDENSQYYIKCLMHGKKVHITDKQGSDMEFIVDLVLEDNFPLTSKRRVIQIPYGEVFVVPKKGSVNGKFVHKLGRDSCVYEIKNDFVHFNTQYYQGDFPVCEVGFGTNPLIPSVGALPYLEKKYDTYHLGFGDNFNFGGSYQYSFHFDQVQDKVEWRLEIL